MELHEAVIEGASVRLRAELFSALIGSISLIPFIISTGTGAEIEKPLAIVVVGGMVMAPVKIVFLPMVYEWVESRPPPDMSTSQLHKPTNPKMK